jgi:hypothetical protein
MQEEGRVRTCVRRATSDLGAGSLAQHARGRGRGQAGSTGRRASFPGSDARSRDALVRCGSICRKKPPWRRRPGTRARASGGPSVLSGVMEVNKQGGGEAAVGSAGEGRDGRGEREWTDRGMVFPFVFIIYRVFFNLSMKKFVCTGMGADGGEALDPLRMEGGFRSCFLPVIGVRSLCVV